MLKRMATAATTSTLAVRKYEDCVHLLNTTQTNAAVLEAVRKAGNSLNKLSLPEVASFVSKIGYTVPSLNSLNVIHIAGTKGKGSTSALCDSILRRAFIVKSDGSKRPLVTGLFSSPHLIQARERIRLNGIPVSELVFSRRSKKSGRTLKALTLKPGYFRFLFLMSLHIFATTPTDAAILETGVGGEYDCTNIIEKPYVTGITSLGLDHQGLLGHTVAEIGWHKAGIMKKGVACFTAPQPADAMKTLQDRAAEKQIAEAITNEEIESLKKRLKGAHQYINAAVAVAACREWVAVYNREHTDTQCELSEDAIVKGLEGASWPGRAQTLRVEEFPNSVFYLDGAHTPESLSVCGEWYEEVLRKEGGDSANERNILIFYCTGGRSGDELLAPLVSHVSARPFTDIVFCSSDSKIAASKAVSLLNVNNTNFTVFKDTAMKTQKANGASWARISKGTIHESARVHLFETVDEALELAGRIGADKPAKTLVTGSMYLVGSVLTRCNAEVV
ncbi:FolC bifunctional protein [Rhizoclosmatium globosum]|uniref:Folylpolyglutamate synthase n=1 Tax=Rhizoclosmatium globosum TaxID=329046 RepID=A0A1Y2CC89_9FUNG|nr:FolC bifunctional protein [Rhizoclosmatium globosum]|eukprot:ORY44671.1 FolC bifunctional protein [Rhizoclosmatium globosum]